MHLLMKFIPRFILHYQYFETHHPKIFKPILLHHLKIPDERLRTCLKIELDSMLAIIIEY
jgi:hypothetical protein